MRAKSAASRCLHGAEVAAAGCTTAGSTGYPRYGFHIVAVDDAGRFLTVGLCSDKVLLANNHLTVPGVHVRVAPYPVAGNSLSLRLDASAGGGVQLLVNNTPLLSVPLGAPYLATGNSRLWFGDGTAWASGETYLSSLRFTASLMTSYCTAGTSSNGCTPSISGLGVPSANAGGGFTIAVTGLEGQRSGLIFYGVNGRNLAPWSGGTSALCVKSPVQRTTLLNSGGVSGACGGAFALDWNAFVASHPGALGAPFSLGQIVSAQAWYRDPPAPGSTNLSDALEFSVCP
ncbi:MAG: hypothetical protein IT454_02285 [Planctomycetes bacterium]|nr:hypothetical protein [Planctomycetota bacterium]